MRTLAVLSIAIGIGLAAALASIIDAVLLRPLPVARPSEIMRVFTASEVQPYGFVSYPDFEDFRAAKSIQGAVAECLIPVAAGDPVRMQLALAVTSDYFQVLGVGAAFGRVFSNEDERAAVAILAYGSASDVGKPLRVGATLYTIIGVAPRNFGLDRFMHEDFYIPIRSYGDGEILEDRSRRFLNVHVRGANAGPELSAIAARLDKQHPQTNRGRRAVALNELTARLRTDKMMTPLAALLGTLAALILAIGCANACGALLMRAEDHAKDIALKMALGAGPATLLAESLREAFGIAALGCAFALPFAWVVTEALRRSIALPSDFAISVATRIDGRILAVAVAAALLCTLVCGLIPQAVVVSRIDVIGVLKSRAREGKGRGRSVLAIAEVALATALTAISGSLWMGLNTARNVDLGFQAKSISVMTFDPAQSGYDETRTRGIYRELMERVKVLPGVRGVALAQSVPFGMTGAQKQVRIRNEDEITVWSNIVSSEYFDRMRIGLIAGRTFEDRDGAVAIVNQELGKRVKVGEHVVVAGKSVEVIGIVKTVKYMHWDDAPKPFLYLPYSQNYISRMTLHIESDAQVFAVVRNLARDVPASDVRMLGEYFENGAMFGAKVALKIAGVVGGGGLLLALAGLYGVVSSSVARRRREIGIRTALGASAGGVFAMVLRQAMSGAALGIAVGLFLAQLGGLLLRGVVPGSRSSPAGASICMGTAVLILSASLAACAIPALKALRVMPASVLRET
jgi:predicted permease